MGLNLHHLPVVVKTQMKQNCKFWIAKSWRQIINDWGGIELVTLLDFVQRFKSSKYIKIFIADPHKTAINQPVNYTGETLNTF